MSWVGLSLQTRKSIFYQIGSAVISWEQASAVRVRLTLFLARHILMKQTAFWTVRRDENCQNMLDVGAI